MAIDLTQFHEAFFEESFESLDDMETQSHLYVALDLGYIDQEQSSELYSLLDEVS